MMKMIYSRFRSAPVSKASRLANACNAEVWRRDPLTHPVLAAMSLSELADLPAASLRSCCRE